MGEFTLRYEYSHAEEEPLKERTKEVEVETVRTWRWGLGQSEFISKLSLQCYPVENFQNASLKHSSLWTDCRFFLQAVYPLNIII